MTPLNTKPIDDYEALISALNEHQVEFIIVGAYAVGYHGYLRATEDMDVLVNPIPRNAARVSAALKDFNGVEVDPAEIRPKTMIELGIKPNALHLITTLTGVTWAKAWTTRAQSEFGAQPAAFLSKECLIDSKRAVGRDKDLLDLIGLGAEPPPPRPPNRKKKPPRGQK